VQYCGTQGQTWINGCCTSCNRRGRSCWTWRSLFTCSINDVQKESCFILWQCAALLAVSGPQARRTTLQQSKELKDVVMSQDSQFHAGTDSKAMPPVCSQLDVRESVHRDIIVKITNRMQPYRLIYYSKSALHVWCDVFAHHEEHDCIYSIW